MKIPLSNLNKEFLFYGGQDCIISDNRIDVFKREFPKYDSAQGQILSKGNPPVWECY